MTIQKGPGVDGIVEIHAATSLALRRAAEILDGDKTHQRDVDYFNELASKLIDPAWVSERQCLTSDLFLSEPPTSVLPSPPDSYNYS